MLAFGLKKKHLGKRSLGLLHCVAEDLKGMREGCGYPLQSVPHPSACLLVDRGVGNRRPSRSVEC